MLAAANTEPTHVRTRSRLKSFNGLQELDDEVRARSNRRAAQAPRMDQDARNGRAEANPEKAVVGERVAVVVARLRSRFVLFFGTCRSGCEEDGSGYEPHSMFVHEGSFLS